MLTFSSIDLIQGIDPVKTRSELLGEPMRRDPDALPPSNKLEAICASLYHTSSALGHGNAVFGFKAGLLSGTVLTYWQRIARSYANGHISFAELTKLFPSNVLIRLQ